MRHALVEGFLAGLGMSAKLLFVLIPAAAVVFLLQQLGLLAPVARLLQPVMARAGLPGEAGLVFATAALLNIYPAIAMLVTLEFTVQETTVIALMILICHSLIVECSVQARAGSNPLRMAILRITAALVAGFLAGRMYRLPGGGSAAGAIAPAAVNVNEAADGFVVELIVWLQSTSATVLVMVTIVTGMMVLQKLLEVTGILNRISSAFEPVVAVFGLPRSTAFLWLVGNTLGLTYGSAILIQEREKNTMTREDIDALNHHLAVSHSLIEDTLLFVALGAAAAVLVIPRLVLAAVVVWLLRAFSRQDRPEQPREY
ncbi:MAG: nucleoside recognition domain-containing protein [Spirochaetaceae bacterium]